MNGPRYFRTRTAAQCAFFSLRLVFLLTLPATLVLLALARPIVALLYQHGKFGASDTMETARALWGYAVGLAAFSGVRVMVPAYYSLGMARIPVMISFVSIGATVVLNFLLMGPMAHAGLALATSIGSVLNFVLLFWMLRSRIGGIGGWALVTSAGKILTAAVAAGVAAWLTAHAVEGVTGLESLAARLAVVGAGLAAALLVYVGMATILRVEELQRLLGRLRGT